MRSSGVALKHPATESGIISLEFAHDSTKTQNIINAWDNDISTRENLIAIAKKNIGFDFIFLILYSSILYLGVLLWGRKDRPLFTYMKVFAIASGSLDIVENILMLRSLGGDITNINSLLTAISASIKFTLIILVILYIGWSIFTRKLEGRKDLN